MLTQTTSLVTAAKQDQRNVGLCAAVALGYLGLGHRSTEQSDFGSFLCSQKFLELSDAADVDGVLFVGSVVAPFKIGHDVIPLHSVKVIDHRELGGVRDECKRDETVNVDVFSLSAAPETDLMISERVGAVPENFSVTDSRLTSIAKPIQTSNAADIADFVKSFKASDASPFFIDHLMGPFARSAHFIVVSDATQGG